MAKRKTKFHSNATRLIFSIECWIVEEILFQIRFKWQQCSLLASEKTSTVRFEMKVKVFNQFSHHYHHCKEIFVVIIQGTYQYFVVVVVNYVAVVVVEDFFDIVQNFDQYYHHYFDWLVMLYLQTKIYFCKNREKKHIRKEEKKSEWKKTRIRIRIDNNRSIYRVCLLKTWLFQFFVVQIILTQG